MEPVSHFTNLEHDMESTAEENKPNNSLAVGLLAWAHVLKAQAHASETATRVQTSAFAPPALVGVEMALLQVRLPVLAF